MLVLQNHGKLTQLLVSINLPFSDMYVHVHCTQKCRFDAHTENERMKKRERNTQIHTDSPTHTHKSEADLTQKEYRHRSE